jgi:hypothetical protein
MEHAKITMLCVLTQLTYIFICSVFVQLGCPLLLLPVGRLLLSSNMLPVGTWSVATICVSDGNRDWLVDYLLLMKITRITSVLYARIIGVPTSILYPSLCFQ